MRRRFRAALLLAATVLGGCDTPKQPRVSGTATPVATTDSAATVALADVSAYVAAKAAYIKSYQAHMDSGKALPAGFNPMPDLEARLRAIVGPVSVGGRTVPTTINLDGLPSRGNMGGDELDGLRADVDGLKIVVSTRGLIAPWLRYHADSTDNPEEGLKRDGNLTQAFFTGAAIRQYADIMQHAEVPADVFVAKLALLAQDVGPWPPEQVIVGFRRGERIYLVLARARVIIPVPSACTNSGTPGFYDCYDRIATSDSAFATIVAQVKEITALLPRK